mgnify:CR=1 FL=1
MDAINKKFGITPWRITEDKTDDDIIELLEYIASENDPALLLHAIDKIASEKGLKLIDAMTKYGVRLQFVGKQNHPATTHI